MFAICLGYFPLAVIKYSGKSDLGKKWVVLALGVRA